jgi:two-component system, NtrC family, response regulator PilR
MYSPSVPTSPLLSPLPELLFVDSEEITARYVAPLREKFRVSRLDAVTTAVQYLSRTPTPPGLVVTELSLPDGTGNEICSAAKSLNVPATVLVTTADVENVPAAIEAGCDAVLLKPFAPNLLFSRLGRLVRARSTELRYRAMRHQAKAQHLRERSDLLLAGTNQYWPNSYCPHCEHPGVTSFEYTSYRRAWYACLSCKKVWLAKRQE